MLLSPLISTTFGEALIAMETEILMASEGITNGEFVGRRDRKLVFLEDFVSSVRLRMLLGINKCRCVFLCMSHTHTHADTHVCVRGKQMFKSFRFQN